MGRLLGRPITERSLPQSIYLLRNAFAGAGVNRHLIQTRKVTHRLAMKRSSAGGHLWLNIESDEGGSIAGGS
jgi:hypothetical protein